MPKRKAKVPAPAGKAKRAKALPATTDHLDTIDESGHAVPIQGGVANKSRPSRKSHGQRQSLLYSLPVELRVMVYTMAMKKDLKKAYNEPGYDDNLDTEPGLLRTCRLIRKEATQLFYANNDFVLRGTGWHPRIYTGRWIDNLNAQAIASIKTVAFVHIDPFRARFAFRVTLTNKKPWFIIRVGKVGKFGHLGKRSKELLLQFIEVMRYNVNDRGDQKVGKKLHQVPSGNQWLVPGKVYTPDPSCSGF